MDPHPEARKERLGGEKRAGISPCQVGYPGRGEYNAAPEFSADDVGGRGMWKSRRNGTKETQGVEPRKIGQKKVGR